MNLSLRVAQIYKDECFRKGWQFFQQTEQFYFILIYCEKEFGISLYRFWDQNPKKIPKRIRLRTPP